MSWAAAADGSAAAQDIEARRAGGGHKGNYGCHPAKIPQNDPGDNGNGDDNQGKHRTPDHILASNCPQWSGRGLIFGRGRPIAGCLLAVSASRRCLFGVSGRSGCFEIGAL
jgi:hypothetical protein